MKLIICLLSLFYLTSCEENEKLFVKEFKTEKGYYQWYYYSLITSNSPDHIDFVDRNCERTLVYKGEAVLNVEFEKGKLIIECEDCNTIELNPKYKNSVEVVEIENPKDLRIYRSQKDSLWRNIKIEGCSD